jgi:hypothetical protein
VDECAESICPSKICAQLQGSSILATATRASAWEPRAGARTPAYVVVAPSKSRRSRPLRASLPSSGPGSVAKQAEKRQAQEEAAITATEQPRSLCSHSVSWPDAVRAS